MVNRATAGLAGGAALTAIGAAYQVLLDNPTIPLMQLHMWATACHDTETRDLARPRTARLYQAAQRISGPDDRQILQLVARGIVVNPMAAIDLPPVKEQPADVRSP